MGGGFAMPHNPETDGTFGAYMRGGAPLGGRSVDVVTGDRTWATRDQVAEGRTPDGGRYKRVTSQAGHDSIYETTPDGRERKHAHVHLR